MSFYFGDFELDPERRQLVRSGEPVPLEPKAYELLTLLLERRPRALSRAQIRDAIWAGTYVSESTLGVVVNAIRQALGDDARQPRFIRTVHGFGYAFCGEARESPAERLEAGKAPAAAGVEAREPAPSEGKPVDDTASGRRAAAPAGRLRMAIIGAGVVVLVVAGWLAIRRAGSSGATTNFVEPHVVPLTSLPGVELQPALSPDGTLAAFIWHGDNRDNFDVYVKNIASGEMIRVTRDPAPDFRPVWSPDGKHLAFLRQQPPGAGAALFVVSPAGGHEQRLRDIAQPITMWHRDMWASSVDWSPEGRYLAVTDRASDSTWGIALVSVETGGKQSLTSNTEATAVDLYPAFSPDGRQLAFFRGNVTRTAWDLHIQPLSGEEPPRARGDAVVVKGVDPGLIAWLPSGDELLVGRQRVALDGSPTRPFSLPGWSPRNSLNLEGVSARGAKLVYGTAEVRPQLLRLPLAATTKAPLVPFFPSTQGEMDPAFAPDGRRVAFTSWRSGDGRLWIGEADGSACRELPLPSVGFPGSPSWSPDGRRLAFDAEVGGTFHVYIATPEGGTLRRLMSERTPGARPRWSRDGRFIYFASSRGGGDWQLWKTRADADDPDADAVQITRSGGMEAAESADGEHLYYAKPQVRGVFRLSLQAPGAPEEKVLDLGGEGRWRLTGRGILVLDLQSGHPPTIRFHDFATRTTSVVLEVPLAPEWDVWTVGGAFTVSPDEQWALIGTFQVVESDIMLLDGFR